MLAAIIHHVLIQIHPFEDGNGRLTRIIASIPLIMCGLPPICIMSENKPSYYEALRLVDKTHSIIPLVDILQKNTIHSMNRMNEILSDVNRENDRIYMYDIEDMDTQVL